MVLLLPAIIDNSPRLHQPLLLIQSSTAQSSLPILRRFILNCINVNNKAQGRTLLFCLLYPPASLLEGPASLHERLQVVDRIGCVPGYSDNWSDPQDQILSCVETASNGPLNVIVDSVDTLSSDLGSVSQTYAFLQKLISLIRARSDQSRLILHLLTPSLLTPLLVQPSFSTSLIHVTAHPLVLLTHLATTYLTPPPPVTPVAKFWATFLPFSVRSYESDRLVFGPGGEGCGGNAEMVVEVLVRGGINGPGRRRVVERTLEGWNDGACELTALESLKCVWIRKAVDEPTSDPTKHASFNLSLTPSQQQSRAQVPLPYAHEGRPQETSSNASIGAIFYDPDSADDIDDDDPDEDLDI